MGVRGWHGCAGWYCTAVAGCNSKRLISVIQGAHIAFVYVVPLAAALAQQGWVLAAAGDSEGAVVLALHEGLHPRHRHALNDHVPPTQRLFLAVAQAVGNRPISGLKRRKSLRCHAFDAVPVQPPANLGTVVLLRSVVLLLITVAALLLTAVALLLATVALLLVVAALLTTVALLLATIALLLVVATLLTAVLRGHIGASWRHWLHAQQRGHRQRSDHARDGLRQHCHEEEPHDVHNTSKPPRQKAQWGALAAATRSYH